MNLKEMFFDQYQRYKIVGNIIDIYKSIVSNESISVLDVGGAGQDRYGKHFLPLEHFAPEIKLTVLDVMEGYESFPNYVKGTGTNIPFEDNQFDFVVTNDTLEHVPEHEREAFIKELLRVTDKYLIITAPFYSEEKYMAENILNEFIINVVKQDNFMLKEHIKNGLPDANVLKKMLKESNLNYATFSSGNIYKWLFMNIIKHYVSTIPNTFDLHLLIDKIYNDKLFNSDKADIKGYRNVFIINKNSENNEFLNVINKEFNYETKTNNEEVITSLNLIKTLIDTRLEQRNFINAIDIQLKPYRPSAKIYSENKYTFEYNSEVDNLCGVSFIIGTYTKRLNGNFKVSVLNKDNNVIEACQFVELQNVVDNHWIDVNFQPIPNSKNINFQVIFECENNFEDGFSILLSENEEPCIKILYRDFEIYDKLKNIKKVNAQKEIKIKNITNENIDLYKQLSDLKLERITIKEKLNTLQNELESNIAKLNTMQNELDSNIAKLNSKENETERLHKELATIYNSNGWKWLLRFYNLRDNNFLSKLIRKLRRRNISQINAGNIQNNVGSRNNDLYQIWLEKNKLNDNDLEVQKNVTFNYEPKISIIVPTYNTPKQFLIDMIESVKNQTYSNWELCIADASSEKDYIREIVKEYQDDYENIKFRQLDNNEGIAENSNKSLEMATGNFIALLDHDDTLSHDALYEIVKVINQNKDVDFIYSDEDKLTEDGKLRFDPHFKPDWSPDTLRSYNYICHLSVIRKEIIDEIGMFRDGFNGSQDYDLFLRITEKARVIYHIPKILYHWRVNDASVAGNQKAKMYCYESAKKALTEHIDRIGVKGKVEDGLFLSSYKIKYEIQGNPLVSIIVPNKDHIEDLDRCIKSIVNKSSYKNYEILIVENNSDKKETFDYYKLLQSKYNNINVLTWTQEFNYSAINNFAAKQSKGEFLLLLNNDTEIINSDWIERMLEHAIRNDVGAVGAKLYYSDNTLQHGGVIIGIGGVAGHSHKYFYKDDLGYMGRLKVIQDLSCVTAACMLVRKDVFDEIAGFDENLKVAFNDVDFCLKIRETGKLIVWTPYAELYHYESKSRGYEDTPEKQERFRGEIEYFHKKWGEVVKQGDPYYNPNFTLITEDFSIKVD